MRLAGLASSRPVCYRFPQPRRPEARRRWRAPARTCARRARGRGDGWSFAAACLPTMHSRSMADGRSPTLIRRPSLHGRSRRTDSERSTTEQTPPRLLTCYIRLWAASTLLRVYTATGRGDPISTPIQLLIIAVLLAALFPARPALTCTALGLRGAIFFAVADL